MNNLEKWKVLNDLKEGSMVQLTNGETAEFIRLKRKNFLAIINGSSYDVPTAMLEKVLKEKEEVEIKDINLKKGELFCISYKNELIIYKYDSVSRDKILGINPITKQVTKIDKSFYKCKVSEL